MPWLRSDHLGHAGYHWAQAVSTVAGLVVVVAWALVSVQRRVRRARPSRVAVLSERAVWVAPVVAAAASGVLAGLVRLGAGIHAAGMAAAVYGTTALAGVATALALAWQVLDRRASTRRVH